MPGFQSISRWGTLTRGLNPLLPGRLICRVRSHWNGLKFRLSLLKMALFRPTNDMVFELTGLLESIGLQFRGAEGNLDPFELLRRLPQPVGLERPNFVRLDDFSFVGEEASNSPEWSSEMEVASFLGRLVKAKKAHLVVELGCYIGRTSSYLASALVEGGGRARLFCVDVNPFFLEIAKQNLSALGLATVTEWVLGRSTDDLVLGAIPSAIDLLYIDSYHDYNNTKKEIEEYSPKMAPGGWIVLHDALRWPGVRKAIKEVAGHFDVFLMGTSQGNGLAVLAQKALS